MKTLVVPEGGELPPEEELQAMEAAEAEAEAAKEAEAEAHRAEAEEILEAELAAEEEAAAATDAEASRQTEPEPAAEAEAEPTAEADGSGRDRPPTPSSSSPSTERSTGLWSALRTSRSKRPRLLWTVAEAARDSGGEAREHEFSFPCRSPSSASHSRLWIPSC